MSVPHLGPALRRLRRQPAFALGAVLTLALAIGAVTATFTIVDALLFRPLPLPQADRIVRIESVRGGHAGSLSYRETLDMRELQSIFADVASYTDQGRYNASGDGRPEELVSTIATQNLFRVLGVPPALGAPWTETLDYTRGFELVISDALWERWFGRDADIIGRSMVLDGAPGYTIRGVMPRGFAFPSRADLYRSAGIAADPLTYEDRANRGRWGLARLQPEVSLTQANAALAGLASRLERDWPSSNTGVSFRAVSLRDIYLGEARPFLLLILGAVALVLVLACVNVTNLFLVHAVALERDVAIRLALGASRAEATRVMLVEGLVVAFAGGICGVALAVLGVPLLRQLIQADLPIWLSLDLSWRALGVAAIVTVSAGVATGAAAASRVGRDGLAGVLREGGRSASGGPRHRRVRHVLVVSQVAFATILLTGGGLLGRSLHSLTSISSGFDSDSLLTFRVELGWRAYPDLAATTRFVRELTRRLEELPEVRSVATTGNLPLDGRPATDRPIRAEGQDVEAQRRNPYVNVNHISASYFETMRIPMLAGRMFTPDDVAGTPQVAIVSRTTAQRFWPGGEALGQRFMLGPSREDATAWREIVGVAEDVRRDGLALPPALDVYLPNEQAGGGGYYFVLRTATNPLSLATRAPQLTWEVDSDQSYFDVQPMTSRLRERTWVPRLATVSVAIFALLAAIIAAIGVYAMLGYTVTMRRQEFGVRQALGAPPSSLAGLVFREGLRLAAIGCLVGTAGAIALARTLEKLLVEVSALDPVVLLLAPSLLVIVASAACLVPARRAARTTPVAALAAE